MQLLPVLPPSGLGAQSVPKASGSSCVFLHPTDSQAEGSGGHVRASPSRCIRPSQEAWSPLTSSAGWVWGQVQSHGARRRCCFIKKENIRGARRRFAKRPQPSGPVLPTTRTPHVALREGSKPMGDQLQGRGHPSLCRLGLGARTAVCTVWNLQLAGGTVRFFLEGPWVMGKELSTLGRNLALPRKASEARQRSGAAVRVLIKAASPGTRESMLPVSLECEKPDDR